MHEGPGAYTNTRAAPRRSAPLHTQGAVHRSGAAACQVGNGSKTLSKSCIKKALNHPHHILWGLARLLFLLPSNPKQVEVSQPGVRKLRMTQPADSHRPCFLPSFLPLLQCRNVAGRHTLAKKNP